MFRIADLHGAVYDVDDEISCMVINGRPGEGAERAASYQSVKMSSPHKQMPLFLRAAISEKIHYSEYK